jgi:hypothetical protein
MSQKTIVRTVRGVAATVLMVGLVGCVGDVPSMFDAHSSQSQPASQGFRSAPATNVRTYPRTWLNPKARAQSQLYVSSFYAKTLALFNIPNKHNEPPRCSLGPVSDPYGLAVSTSHDLYEADGLTYSLNVFSPSTSDKCGALTLSVPIPDGTEPADVAIDNTHRVAYVVTISPSSVYPIQEGSGTFEAPLHCNLYSTSFVDAADKEGNVFVAGRPNGTGQPVIVEFKKGKAPCEQLNVTGTTSAGGLIVDSKRNLIDIDYYAGILIYKPPYKGSPSRTISQQGHAVFGALDASNKRLYLADYVAGAIDVYDYKTGKFLYSFDNGLTQSQDVQGVAVDPPQK